MANFCFGLWNVYSNTRQEKKQALYDQRQQEIVSRLEELKRDIRGGTSFEAQDCEKQTYFVE